MSFNVNKDLEIPGKILHVPPPKSSTENLHLGDQYTSEPFKMSGGSGSNPNRKMENQQKQIKEGSYSLNKQQYFMQEM